MCYVTLGRQLRFRLPTQRRDACCISNVLPAELPHATKDRAQFLGWSAASSAQSLRPCNSRRNLHRPLGVQRYQRSGLPCVTRLTRQGKVDSSSNKSIVVLVGETDLIELLRVCAVS